MLGARLSGAMLVAGAAGLVALLPLTAGMFVSNPQAAMYAIPFTASFAAGAIAYRLHPANFAARWLLAFGTAAVWWTVLNFSLLFAYRSWGGDSSLAVPNAAVLSADLIFTTTLLGALVAFPDGSGQRARERLIVVGGYWLALVVPVLSLLFASPAVRAAVLEWNESELGVARIENPYALAPLDWLAELLAIYAQAVFPLAALIGGVILFQRYRQATQSLRRRFRWLLVGAIALALTEPMDGLASLDLLPRIVADGMEVAVLTAIPTLIAIAIVRPDLMDVDIVVRRTLAYGALWLTIAGAYVALAAALGLAAGSVGIQLAVAVTLVATLLFKPGYERMQRSAARRVYGERDQLRRSLRQSRREAHELAASRARIVEAEEAARRRIERDIHDGVQQGMVALVAKIGIARNQLIKEPSELAATLDDLRSEAQQAVADLRELASGIHPSVLTDRGVVEAIEGRASRLPLGVTIEFEPDLRSTRFGKTAEGAVYFLVCEGFGNALKHSGAERVFVRLGLTDGELWVEVADDGRGFDSETVPRSGLSGLEDRIDALGGRFAVTSAPGKGTTLSAGLPVDVVILV